MALSEEEQKEKERKLREELTRSQRLEAGIAFAFGGIVLAAAFYLASDDVPLLRQGRLVLAFVLGFAALAYGAGKLFGGFRDW